MFAFDSRCDNRCVQETRNCQKKNYSLEGIQKLSKQPYSGHVLSTAIAIKLFYGIWYSQSYDAENNHECICRPIFSSALWMIWMLSCNAGRSLLINVTNWNNRWWMAMINCIDPVLVTASSTPGSYTGVLLSLNYIAHRSVNHTVRHCCNPLYFVTSFNLSECCQHYVIPISGIAQVAEGSVTVQCEKRNQRGRKSEKSWNRSLKWSMMH